MKNPISRWTSSTAFLFLTMVGACGGSSAPPPPTLTSAAPPAGDPIAYRAEVRLLGVDAAGFDAVYLAVRDLAASDGTHRLAVRPGQTRYDLANARQAWLVGIIDVPAGAAALHVALRFDEYGAYQSSAGAGVIDARTSPVEFDASAAWLETQKMVTVQLHIADSLVDAIDGVKALVPQLAVSY